jgi:hypothetical protein
VLPKPEIVEKSAATAAQTKPIPKVEHKPEPKPVVKAEPKQNPFRPSPLRRRSR